jgi:hypothetical protein
MESPILCQLLINIKRSEDISMELLQKIGKGIKDTLSSKAFLPFGE